MTSISTAPDVEGDGEGIDAEPQVAVADPSRPVRRWDRWDAIALVTYCAAAVWVTSRLWGGDANTMVRNSSDEAVSEWFFAHGAHWVTHGGNPFFSRQILLPGGANMMANTSMLGLSIPLSPITLIFGAHVTFMFVLTGVFAATGFGWYYVMSRHFVTHRAAAVLAGAMCGFGPAMIGHAEGQLDLVSNFLVPFIVLGVLRLREPGHSVRRGILLGVLTAYQLMIAEEPLFLAAVTTLLFLVFYGLQKPRRAATSILPLLRGLAVAGVTMVVLAGYPLWFQFFGPRHGTGLMSTAANSGVTINQFVDTAPSSLGGNPTLNNEIWSRSESDTYFGWVLLSVVFVLVVWRCRDAVIRSLFAAGLVVAALSCGRTITNGHWSLAGPFRLVSGLPLFDTVTPPRFGMAVMCVLGVLIALAADRLMSERRAVVRGVGWGVLCVALLPMIPTPLSIKAGPVVPRFVTTGAWRGYVGPGQSMVVAPMPALHKMDAMRWASVTNTDLPLARGYMLAPIGADGTPVAYDPPQRPLGALLDRAALNGIVPMKISTARRLAVIDDLRYWHAAIVCVAVDQVHVDDVVALGRKLFGEPTLVDGVWLWDVRAMSAGG